MKALIEIYENYNDDGYAVYETLTPEIVNMEIEGLVEYNTELVEGDGIAVRLSDKGLVAISDNDIENFESRSNVEVDSDVPIPKTIKRGGRKPIYPYDTMEVGDSFHVSTEPDDTKTVRRLTSTTSSAIIRNKVEKNGKMVKTKDFSVRTVDETDPKGPGVRVWRTK